MAVRLPAGAATVVLTSSAVATTTLSFTTEPIIIHNFFFFRLDSFKIYVFFFAGFELNPASIKQQFNCHLSAISRTLYLIFTFLSNKVIRYLGTLQ